MKSAFLRLTAVVSLVAAATAAQGTDVAPVDQPLTNSVDKDVKPSIMFILDDSGSMGWEYMPDSVGSYSGSRCYRNHNFNRIYYNPSTTYTPPVKANGDSYGNMSYPNAKTNGFAGSGTTDLSGWYYYQYTGTTPATPVVGTCYASTSYTQVSFASLTAAQKQNVANWYSYYRTRMLMMKTAVTLAFKGVDDSFRIGYMSINNVTGSDFMNPAVFDETGKTAWYAKLVAAGASGGTGTRWALSTAGRLYAGKLNGTNFRGSIVVDPVKYSCQQNATILSTDGFWNTSTTGNGCSYHEGCYPNGSQMGNTDSTAALPYRDVNNGSGTLSDIAYYYFSNDLRADLVDNVFPVDSAYPELQDTNKFQHMITHTIGLGLSGTLPYQTDYLSCTSCTYANIKAGTVSWPKPVSGNETTIDDLWHAAVNGHGRYYGATDPEEVKEGLAEILAGMPTPGGGGAPAASAMVASLGDGFYKAGFKTREWSGDLQKYLVTNEDSFAISSTAAWSAQAKIDAMDWSKRNILVPDQTTGTLVKFEKANLTAAISSGWFDVGPTNPNGALEQQAFFTATQKTAATPEALVNFVRGDRSLEDATNKVDETDAAKIFRGRASAMGDIVNSSPIYVGNTLAFDYQDKGYLTTFQSKVKAREPMILVGGNDGMLHAFSASSGDERWAFVPSAVLPYLYKLAGKNYFSHHRYFVDGPLTVGDVDFGTGSAPDWRTVLIGGLGKGGKSFFALDITDTNSPKLLWEYSVTNAAGSCVGHSFTKCDKDLGYTFGNAPMTRLNMTGDVDTDGSVAIFASGYDNTGVGDSNGYLYMVDVKTGTLKAKLPAGTDKDPSLTGMAWVNGWNDDGMRRNYVEHAYAGDLGGRVWRFNLKTKTSTLMTTLGGSTKQPVTTRIELGDFDNDVANRVLYVGTGRYLSSGDVDNKDIQSIYAIRDTALSTSYPIGGTTYFRDVAIPLLQSGNRGTTDLVYNNVTTNPYGWYMDFNASGGEGERIIVHPRVFASNRSNLYLVTNQPVANKCDIGGTGYLYVLNAQATGQTIKTVESVYTISGAMGMGAAMVNTKGGAQKFIVSRSDGTLEVISGDPVTFGNSVRRISYRELRN